MGKDFGSLTQQINPTSWSEASFNINFESSNSSTNDSKPNYYEAWQLARRGRILNNLVTYNINLE